MQIDVREAPAGPAVDAACAEAMPRNEGYILLESPDFYSDGFIRMERRPCQFSTSWDAAGRLEQHTDDHEEYLVELMRVVNYDNGITEDDFNLEEAGLAADWLLLNEDVWHIAWATPHQRARAFLLASGIEKIEVKEE